MNGGELGLKLRLSLMLNQWKAFFVTLKHGKKLDQHAFDYFKHKGIMTKTQIKILGKKK